MTGLVDVIVGYDCNLACDYCTITPAMRARALAAPTIVGHLRAGRRDGFDRVAFTGGEPTIRGELLGLVRAARQLGFVGVRVQTNGLVLGQGDNAARLIAAGCDDLHLSIHTHEPSAYDAMVRRPGAYPLLVAGVERAVATGVPVTLDVIMTTATVPRLPAAVAWAADRGAVGVDLWLVSLTDGNADHPASLPRMTAVMPEVRAARAVAAARGLRLRSLHLPRCVLGADADLAYDPGADRVRVVSPDAVFDLARSRLAGQVFVPACDGCPHRAVCPGLRPDYLARFGDGEIAAARGVAATAPRRALPVA
jgi:hypothetical protein